MSTICGANCDNCFFKAGCCGCEATCGRPFGGSCIAAEYIKTGGKEKYLEFKQNLLGEINGLLEASGIPCASALYELKGEFVNLTYTLPNRETAEFLDNNKIYLGTQIELADNGLCYGVVADMGFILVSSYGENGSNPELIMYHHR